MSRVKRKGGRLGPLRLVHPEEKGEVSEAHTSTLPWKENWALLPGAALRTYSDNSASLPSATFPETIVWSRQSVLVGEMSATLLT